MADPIRILHVLGTTSLGGAESRIMDLYRHMDRKRVQFDFMVHTEKKGHFDEEIEKLGGHIYHVPRFKVYNYFVYRRQMKLFFASHKEFRAVQGHMTSTASIYLPIAKKAGIPITAAHARSAGVDSGIKGNITKWMRRNLSQKADFLFTCSKLAGEAVYGKKAAKAGKITYIPNAIDASAYIFDGRMRKGIREELKLSDQFVIGHVGRFHYAKNHEYLLQVFAEILKKQPRSVLMLLGEGGGMEQVKEQAQQLGIGNKVLFLGNRGNISDYYQGMDYFVFPSRFEGLPGTVVEAQASGLRCLISDTIAEEVVITKLVQTASIGEEPKEWAIKVLETADYERRNMCDAIAASGFDVKTQGEKMMFFYENGMLSDQRTEEENKL